MTSACRESILTEDPVQLEPEDFTFIPEKPTTDQEVKMIYYGCGYNETSSVSIEDKKVLVIKKFNGAMKRPCILEYDTTHIGKLASGSYQVTLEIIDINPFIEDSLFSSRTKTLRVVKF